MPGHALALHSLPFPLELEVPLGVGFVPGKVPVGSDGFVACNCGLVFLSLSFELDACVSVGLVPVFGAGDFCVVDGINGLANLSI